MTEVDFEKYLTGQLKQIAREEEELQVIVGQAKEKAGRIADLLVEKYDVSRVWLFGSLLHGNFHFHSDIDLAVEGIPEENYLKAYGIVEDVAAPLRVDLVLLENALPSLRECILKEGKLLYDG